jgi:hypothetical protein
MRNLGNSDSAVCRLSNHRVSRNLLFASFAAMTGLISANGRAAVIENVDTSLTPVSTSTIGQSSGGIRVPAGTPGAVYSDVTNFTGYAAPNGTNGTTLYTALVADDITTTASSPFTLSQFTFSVCNLATVSQTISPYIRFFAADGTGGGPGTLLGGLNFNGIPISSNAVDGFNYNAASSAIVLPTTFWAAEFFSTTSTAANAEDIGEGLFSPVDVGSSLDEEFLSSSFGTASSSFASSAPAGSVDTSPYGGAPAADFEFEFNAVPEPASLGLAATSGLLLIRRRRKA